MFIPGPSRQSTLLYAISSPASENSSYTSSVLNVEAIRVPFGRLNAFVPQSSLIPDGPSDVQQLGMPKSISDCETPANADVVPGVTFGLPIPSPRIMQARSLSESCAINSSIVFFPLFTSASFMPLSPVCGISAGRFAAIIASVSISFSGTGSLPSE